MKYVYCLMMGQFRRRSRSLYFGLPVESYFAKMYDIQNSYFLLTVKRQAAIEVPLIKGVCLAPIGEWRCLQRALEQEFLLYTVYGKDNEGLELWALIEGDLQRYPHRAEWGLVMEKLIRQFPEQVEWDAMG
jgi:hypothetical protein